MGAHEKLIDLLRDLSRDNRKASEFFNRPTEELIREIFRNPRGEYGNMVGCSLTGKGVRILKPFFEHSVVPPGPKPLTSRALLYLDRTQKLPYHIAANGEITFFDVPFAAKLHIMGGDIELMMDSYGFMASD